MRNKKRTATRILRMGGSIALAIGFVAALTYFMQGNAIPVLQPQGTIAHQQYILILITVGLGVFVVVPVFILLFSIAWKYREGNTKAQYDPEMHGSTPLELLWWGIPGLIIITLSIITAISTFALDPYKPLESDTKPVKVQVVALQWKWLFIYPEEGVATVNHLVIPEKTPIEFSVTSDAPMNSFWIPALGGQVYAMTGMKTKLHLMANSTGTYVGNSANLSGDGYSSMYFNAQSVSADDFTTWVETSKSSTDWLTKTSYEELRKPTKDAPKTTYGLVEDGMFDSVIQRYMSVEGTNKTNQHVMEGTN